ncbi:VanZ family protein [Endozoicomonas acroporae]|uniref:VanZ family protein n=1 Tax=Endozoicomonas acroporae TaxID=1701104 RepID=UPI000C76FE9F|nr:VanZ family protein [Endozoicomonas acroporae]
MVKILAGFQVFPPALYRFAFVGALAFALFMAVIPHCADPTAAVNDKVKHAIAFMVLFAMLDLAWPTVGMPWWKPLGLMAFGVLIEVCQKMTGYRSFSVGDIVANGVGVLAYLGVYLVISR